VIQACNSSLRKASRLCIATTNRLLVKGRTAGKCRLQRLPHESSGKGSGGQGTRTLKSLRTTVFKTVRLPVTVALHRPRYSNLAVTTSWGAEAPKPGPATGYDLGSITSKPV
jgi:hypothetical protein